ncbi:MAG: tRNA (adenosine(37)-N6)-dimethylallyltransferase MiaA [bacterium]|jgi:tRNA dimethylallyltransferase
MPDRVIVIVGPTAVGKTRVSIALAQRCAGEIISADSMLVYRGMDIGTAKPTPAERQGVPHHLIDIIDPDEPFSVADYQREALTVIADIISRGNTPILVGGTGLYVQAVTDNYEFSESTTDWSLRRRLEAEADLLGNHHLHARLREVDPVTAKRLHPNDRRRVIRALEVYRQSGIPMSESGQKKDAALPYRFHRFGLTLAREQLYRRIEERVDTMLANGLLEEVKGLLVAGFSPELFPLRSLGYKQLIEHLRGDYDLATAAELIKRDTRRFAKRQMTWFKRDQRITWYDVGKVMDETDWAEKISKCLAGNLTEM